MHQSLIRDAREMAFKGVSNPKCVALFKNIRYYWTANMGLRAQTLNKNMAELFGDLDKPDIYHIFCETYRPPLLGTSLLDALQDDRIWISYSSNSPPNYTGHSGSTLDIAITSHRVKDGVAAIAGTIVHELAHLAGITSDRAFHEFAYTAKTYCT